MSVLVASPPPNDTLNWSGRALDDYFSPKTVAVICATEAAGSVGRTPIANLTDGSFYGRVFPVNRKRATVLGHRAYADVASIPERLNLAVIPTPAVTVPGVIRECADAGVKAAVIITAGFRETGATGLELEQQILAEARRGRMRIIGPNCLGLMNPLTGLNATFAASVARPGNMENLGFQLRYSAEEQIVEAELRL